MTLYMVSHASDPDGIIAHALAKRYAGTQHMRSEHFFIDYATSESRPQIITLDTALEQIQKVDPGSVIIADTGYPEHLSGNLLSSVASRSSDATWYDHHESTNKYQDSLTELGYRVVQDQGSCAAQLMREDLGLQDLYEMMLAELGDVHDYLRIHHDFWPAAEALEEVITSGFSLNKLVSDLAKEQVFNRDFTNLNAGYGGQVVDDYRRKVANAIIDLHDNITVESVCGREVAFVKMDLVLYMKRGMRELEKIFEDDNHSINKPDFSILLTPGINNTMIQGYKEGRNLVPTFCGEFSNGGGRESRGGFALPQEIYDGSFESQSLFIQKKFADFFMQR